MIRDDAFFTSISEKHTLALLLYLKDAASTVILKDLQHITNHTQTLRMRLDEMEEDGLVDIEITSGIHRTVNIILTDLGNEITLMLSMANSLVTPEKDVKEKSIDMKYADPILRTLRGHTFLMQADILKVIPIYRNVVKVLGALEKDGLVRSELSKEKNKNIRYSLTQKGKQVADAFQFVYEKIINDSIDHRKEFK